jgi:S-adenosylmethionine:diacylglycerol 3-amino-3-carboxypropyl transferase
LRPSEAKIELARSNLWHDGSRLKSSQEHQILFGHVQEDTSLEASLAFGARALCIGSGGETAFDLLLGGAKDVVAIDINPAQALLVHLKAAVLRNLSSAEINAAFLENGTEAYKKIRSRLPREVTDYFDRHLGDLSNGLVNAGRIDKDLRRAMRLFQKFVHSRKQIERLIQQPTVEDQARYFAAHWNNGRLNLGLKLAFHPIVLNRVFGKQFGSLAPRTFADQVKSDLEKVLTTVPLEDNPYVWQTFFSTYPPDGLPSWLTPFGHRRMAQVISRLGLEVGDVSDWMLQQTEPLINLVCLSNILDGASDDDRSRLMKGLSRAIAEGGYVVARSLFDRPIGLDKISDGQLTRVEISDWIDRSLICRNVEVYRWSTR